MTLWRENEVGDYVQAQLYYEVKDGKTIEHSSVQHTDENGHYKFEGLPEGNYRVRFESTDGADLGQYDVTEWKRGTETESSKVDRTEKTLGKLTAGIISNIEAAPTLDEMVCDGKTTWNMPDQNMGLILPE